MSRICALYPRKPSLAKGFEQNNQRKPRTCSSLHVRGTFSKCRGQTELLQLGNLVREKSEGHGWWGGFGSIGGIECKQDIVKGFAPRERACRLRLGAGGLGVVDHQGKDAR